MLNNMLPDGAEEYEPFNYGCPPGSTLSPDATRCLFHYPAEDGSLFIHVDDIGKPKIIPTLWQQLTADGTFLGNIAHLLSGMAQWLADTLGSGLYASADLMRSEEPESNNMLVNGLDTLAEEAQKHPLITAGVMVFSATAIATASAQYLRKKMAATSPPDNIPSPTPSSPVRPS